MISSDNSILKTFHFIAVLVIILAGIIASQEVINLILLALFFSIIVLQPILILEKKKIPYTIAIFIVLSGVSLILFVFGATVGNSISKLMQDLPLYGEKLSRTITALIANLNELGLHVNEEQLSSILNYERILSFTKSVASELGNLLSDYFLISLMMIFMLLEFKNFSLKVKLIEKKFDKSMGHINIIAEKIRHYWNFNLVKFNYYWH